MKAGRGEEGKGAEPEEAKVLAEESQGSFHDRSPFDVKLVLAACCFRHHFTQDARLFGGKGYTPIKACYNL